MPKRKTNSPPGILTVVGDMHSVSTTGLCPPRIELDDGGDYRANKFQRWLWDQWRAYWEDMGELKERLGLPLITVFNGDAMDGDHHGTAQIFSNNPVTMLRTAADVIMPALDVSDCWYVIRGTESHTGKSAWLEEKLAEDIGAIRPSSNAWSWWHLDIEVGGVLFNIQHHPESGDMRPWTRGGGANRIAAIVTYDYASSGDRIPDVAIRNHRHKWGDSGTNHPVRAFQIPAWQGPTAFVHRIGAGGGLPLFGGIYFICDGGSYTWDRRVFRPARAKPVRPEVQT